MSRPIVVKVGGSLLDWPPLAERLGRFLDDGDASRCVLLPGGGRAADAIRAFDRFHRLGQDRAHALALRALDLTARMLAELLPRSCVVSDRTGIVDAWKREQLPILAPRRWLDEDDASPEALPHHWDVTSDAIAARLAVLLGAPRLALLKSAPCPDPCDRHMAARLGLVDPTFPDASRTIREVLYHNLRDPTAMTRRLG